MKKDRVKIDFTQLNNAIHAICGSDRHADYSTKVKNLHDRYLDALRIKVAANGMKYPSIRIDNQWLERVDTDMHLSSYEPDLNAFIKSVDNANAAFAQWYANAQHSIRMAKELAAENGKDGIPRDYSDIKFIEDNNEVQSIRVVPSKEEKRKFELEKLDNQEHANNILRKLCDEEEKLKDEIISYKKEWEASTDGQIQKQIVAEIDAKNVQIRNCKTVVEFLKLCPNPTTEEMKIFDSNRV
jgi:hypothetical protein